MILTVYLEAAHVDVTAFTPVGIAERDSGWELSDYVRVFQVFPYCTFVNVCPAPSEQVNGRFTRAVELLRDPLWTPSQNPRAIGSELMSRSESGIVYDSGNVW